jgi:hypothetical protein
MASIATICKNISKLLEKARPAAATIPGILLVCSAVKRPGLSSMTTTANIIRRQAEAGAPIGPAADGSANISEAMERIRVEEIFKAIKMDARVQVGIPIGGIQFTGTGANAGGAVTVTGFNINAPHGDGVVQ